MPLYDANGNLVDLPSLKQEQAAPSLTSVRQILSAHPSAGLTPTRLARLLKASEEGDATAYLELAEDMEEKDLHYRAQLQTRKLACSGLDLVVEAASDAKPDQMDADLVREALAAMDMEEHLVDILDALGKGYSASEILWDTEGRQWMPRSLVWRDPRWFRFSQEDGTTLLLQDGAMGQPLAPYKWMIHRPKLKSGLPIRGGLARAAAWSYLFGNYVIKDWVAFCEIFGQPIRVGKYPAGTAPDQIDILKAAVAQIGTDAAAVMPDGMLLEFVESAVKGASSDLYEKLLRYLDERVTLAVLGQTLTSGQTQGGGGSMALGRVHNQVRMDLRAADARQASSTLQRDLVRPTVDLNRGPRKVYPRIRLHVAEPEDLTAIAAQLSKLVPLGLQVEQSVVRDRFGWPDPPKGADVQLLGAPNQPQKPDQPAQAAQAAHAQAQPGPDALDRLAEQALSDWIPQLAPLANPLIQAIQQAQTYDELRAALAVAAQSMDPSALAEALAQASFVSALAGNTGADLAD